ncbi:MAG: cytochrome c3 family protein [Sphingomonadaceae bacterium]|nr:cytochrome c3 family protein [Sphingomonadaceae bacterium]
MSFIVRQISRTAEGREIIRPREFDQEVLTVGRDTASDIHLADLAVTLNHATIRQLGPDRIRVATEKDLPFTVNGRTTSAMEIPVAGGAEIRFGSHRLMVSRDPEGGAGLIRIDVERVEALSDASEAKDEAKVFSLAGKMPSKRAVAWGTVIVVLLVFLAWPILTAFQSQGVKDRGHGFHADQTWTAGPLSLAHKTLETNCQACHQKPFVAVRDDSCLACHAGVHDHGDPRRLAVAKAAPAGFDKIEIAFKGAFNIPEGRCVDCHLEHEGATRMPPARQKFCADCHGSLSTRLTDTEISDAADFGTAHPQFRPAVAVNFDGPSPIIRRVSLDQQPKEDNGLKFPHAMHLSTTNGVAQMVRTMSGEQNWGQSLQCKDCHTPDANGAGFRPVTMEQNCQMCHDLAFDKVDGTIRTLRHGDPRQVVAELRSYYGSHGVARPPILGGMGRRIPGQGAAATAAADYYLAVGHSGGADAAIAKVFSPGGACYDCHMINRATNPYTLNFEVHPVRLPQRYFKLGWFDHRAHETESCESCHSAKKSNSATDVMLPGIATCRSCHGGESAHVQVPSSCAMCHDYHRGDGAPFATRTGNGSTSGGEPVANRGGMSATGRADPSPVTRVTGGRRAAG